MLSLSEVNKKPLNYIILVPRGPLCLTLLPVPVSFLVITISLSSTDPPPTIPVTVFFLVPALGRVLLPWKDGP